MKILPFKIPKTSDHSFHLQIDEGQFFFDYFHKHPEIQITEILKGQGKLFVGDYMDMFQPGDVYVIGSDLPHVFRSDPKYYSSDCSEASLSKSLFIEWEALGKKIWELPESKRISDFASYMGRGLKLQGNLKEKISHRLKSVFRVQDFDRILAVLKLINELSKGEEMQTLSSYDAHNGLREKDGKLLDRIHKFTINEYHRKITLSEVAALANLTNNSFCRYFKKHSRKSYIDFLSEVRISRASQLLLEKDSTVSEICYEVGFNNISNFNRKFKDIYNCTPSQYRKLNQNPLHQ